VRGGSFGGCRDCAGEIGRFVVSMDMGMVYFFYQGWERTAVVNGGG